MTQSALGRAYATELGAEAAQALSRWFEHGSPADLDRAIASLLGAQHEDPEHPDAARWCWQLAIAYGARAWLEDSPADYDEAIEWSAALYDGLQPGDVDRDRAAVTLADALWDASWQRRYRGLTDTPAADARALVDALDAIELTGHSSGAAAYHQLLAGCARLELAGYATDAVAPELDEGVTAVTAALTALDGIAAEDPDEFAAWADEQRSALALGLLSEAYAHRAGFGGDDADLDRAVAAALAALDRWPDADEPANLLQSFLAEARHQRWLARDGHDPREPGELDAAIAAWTGIIGDDADDFARLCLGDLLTERARRLTEAADARLAVELLIPLARRHDAPPAVWRSLGSAQYQLGRFTQDRDTLLAAAEHLDRAIAADVWSDDQLLCLHQDRILTEQELSESGLKRSVSGPTGPVSSLRRSLVDAGYRAMQRAIEADPDLRAMFATVLGLGEIVSFSGGLDTIDPIRVRGLLHLGLTMKGADRQLTALIQVFLGVLDHYEDVFRPGMRSDGGLSGLTRVLADGALDAEMREGLRTTLASAMMSRSSVTGDFAMQPWQRRRIAGGDATVAEPEALPGVDDPDLLALAEVLRLSREGNDAQVLDVVRRLRQRAESGAIGEPLAGFIRGLAATVEFDSVPVELPEPSSAATLDGSLARANAMIAAMTLTQQSIRRADIDGLRRAAEHAEAVLAAAPASDLRIRQGATHGAAQARLELARLTPVDATGEALRAVGHFEAAMRLVRGHRHAMWSAICMGHATAQRLAGAEHRARSRSSAVAALRGHAWQVFAQVDTEDAVPAARLAAENARTAAEWCLADLDDDAGVIEELIAVLDAGRALVLRAVAGARTIVDRLIEAGRPDLADEWRATAGRGRDLLTGALLGSGADDFEVPDQLRLTAMHALGGEDLVGFEPVGSHDIRLALGALGADALVYLLAGAIDTNGVAVVVPRDRRPFVHWLPQLRLDPASPAHRYAQPGSPARALRELPPQPATDAPDTLADVCRWAWDVAVGELIQLARGGALGPEDPTGPPGRPARLVLVPLGLLGVVPWHAAWTTAAHTPGTSRHAIDDLVLSYCPSAQMLCEIARRPARPVQSALIVGDPGGDLAFAGLEARTVQQRFYPDGAYFGRPAEVASRPGTPDDVLGWLDAEPPGPLLLHFACHGAVEPAQPMDAYLVLAGGARLSAQTLLERARVAAVPIGQVFLAACTSGVSGSYHDEVLTLATSFLVAGADTVFGSLWPVPDGATSVLMYMVHHFLRTEGCGPADALHRAQRWMLATDRQLPAGMPVELQRHCAPGITFGPAAWAGFTHAGR